jgi:putative spermidine/putrescine transport system ATP-binding protein
MLEIVGLDGYGSRFPRELSGGQQQRVALARALVFSPKLLLLDEPLGALDKRLRESLQAEIKRVHREVGVTFVFVTHDQEEALAMSDRIAVFNNGAIEQVGSATALYETPETLFVATFLGDSNVIEGTVQQEGPGSVLVSGDLRVVVPSSSAPGTHQALVIRPERMSIVTDPAHAAPGANTVSGIVHDIVYLGSHRRIVVNHGDRQFLIDEGAGTTPPAVGDSVVMSWQPDHSRLVTDRKPALA